MFSLLAVSATFLPNALRNLHLVLFENVGDGDTQSSFCLLFPFFLLKKKEGKENFIRSLRLPFPC